MKLNFAILLLGSLLSAAAQGVSFESPLIVPTTFNKIYAPDGFDSNDNVQIVGQGYFPNSCYRYSNTSIAVDHETKTITLAPTAYKYEGICLMVLLPFDGAMDVGILKNGTYSIIQASDKSLLGKVSIHPTKTLEPDDYHYAPITQAYFKSARIFLTGNMPLSCMKIKEVRSNIQTDVVVIQPIVEFQASTPCEEGEFPFETSVDASALKKGRYLIHVRSMNGKSVNTLIDVP